MADPSQKPAPAVEDGWSVVLDDLLTGRGQAEGDLLPGGQLVVADESGEEVFRAALARHWRQDPGEPGLVWIRPLPAAGRYQGLPAFDPAIARRRALTVSTAQIVDGSVVLRLSTGQQARIEPAVGKELETLADWDDWWTTLPETLQAELDSLTTDT